MLAWSSQASPVRAPGRTHDTWGWRTAHAGRPAAGVVGGKGGLLRLFEGRVTAPLRAGLLHDVSQLFERARSMEVLVLGDAVLDVWSYGYVRRLGREGPVPVVEVDVEDESP